MQTASSQVQLPEGMKAGPQFRQRLLQVLASAAVLTSIPGLPQT